MVVYVDILIILNLYINYFLIRATAVITRRKCSRVRCVSAAFVGALGALAILLPEMPFFVVVLFKAALGALIVFIAFSKRQPVRQPRQKPADFFICLLFFLVVNFTFAGVMMALWRFAAPLGMVFSNGTTYFNIPIAAIAAFTAAAYFAVRLVRLFADKRLKCDKICEVKISANGGTVTLRGLCDTGNGLCDMFTGKPIIVCDLDKIAPIAPPEVLDYFNGKLSESIRIVPCRTISAETLVPLFNAEILIDGKTADGFAGVTRNPLGDDIDCVFNPKIISI